MNKHEWDELKDEIAQALVASGCGYGSPVTERFAEVVREIALPWGEHGICLAEDCRNAATTDIGFPVCRWHAELTDVGAAWSTFSSDTMDAWGVRVTDGWVEAVEAVIRERIAAQFSALAEAPDRSPAVQLAYRDAARIALGEPSVA